MTWGRAHRLWSGWLGVVLVAASAVWRIPPAAAAVESPATTAGSPSGPSLKICNISDASSLQGREFAFTEDAGPLFQVRAGPATNPGCSSLRGYATGTRVKVGELAAAGVDVTGLTVKGGVLGSVDPSSGTATVTVGAGVTVVRYDDEPGSVPRTGYVSVCRYASDRFVSGSSTFTLAATRLRRFVTIPVGECSPALQVPAGAVMVTQATAFPYVLHTISALPAVDLVDDDPGQRSALVSVPPSAGVSNRSEVDFTDGTRTGRMEICDALTGNSSALAGTTFKVEVTKDFVSTTGRSARSSVSVTAGKAGSTVCRYLADRLPLGTRVTVAQVVPTGSDFAPIAGNPSVVTIEPGTNTAKVTDEAIGTIQVCAAPPAGQPIPDPAVTLPFTIAGAGAGVHLDVPVGYCSMPRTVPAGPTTVTEGPVGAYHFVRALGNGDRLLSSLPSGSASYSVVAGGGGATTLATFVNAVDRARFSICEQAGDSSGGLLDGTMFRFRYGYEVNGRAISGWTSLTPGECSLVSSAIPVVNSDGSAVTVHVRQEPDQWAPVADIGVSGSGDAVAEDPSAGTATFDLGRTRRGTTDLTYVNQAVLGA